jgi:hypothetical protein
MTAREAMHKYLCQLEEVQHIHGFHLNLVREKAEAAILEERERNRRKLEMFGELVVKANEFREAVLHERYQLAESGLDGDQVNAVLGLFDDTIGSLLARARELQ